ncbi:MAG: hypothetical protein Aseana_01070 [Candidatus Pelagadaptatus aseana]|uniref:hypothetical protein n=1 Tax=Candidatus Pelagadaptatus aseana TaxID=3120508 RepID=UPI0039B22438
MKKAMKVLTAIAVINLTACASIVSDDKYSVNITGSEGIRYKIKNKHGVNVASGITPNMVVLSASDGYFDGAEYTIEYKSDCDVQVSSIDSSVDGWYWGNIIFGGILGMLIVDPATGAMFELPESVSSQIQTECESVAALN